MATETIPRVDNSSLFSTNLADLFLGKTTTTNTGGSTQTTSGQTQTTSEDVSSDKTAAIVRSILEGTSGLASVASGQKSAGLYNSTVNTQLVNDLLSRTAGQTAALSKTTTQTVSPTEITKTPVATTTKTAPQASAGKALTGLLGLQLVPSGIKDKISQALGISSPASMAAAKAKALEDGTLSSTSSAGVANTVAGQDAAYSAANAVTPATAATGALVDTGADLGGVDVGTSLGASIEPVAALDAGINVASAGAAADVASTGAAADVASAGAAGLGENAVAGAAIDTGADLGGAAIATDAAGLDVAGTVASAGVEDAGLGEILGEVAKLAAVICTELVSQGKLTKELYAKSHPLNLTYPSVVINGYHVWAMPYARLMAKSKILSGITTVFVNAWANQISGEKPNFLGKLTHFIGIGLCTVTSKLCTKKFIAYSNEVNRLGGM